MDHAGPFMGHMFFILIHAHSKWIEASIVNSTSSETTIKKLEEIFTIHGYPEQLVTDNGTGFTSADIKLYTQNHGILHTFATLYHPSTNGLAERSVQILKQGLRKQEGPIHTKLINLLFYYRITPQTTTGLCPAELLMGRRLHCKFTLLHPDTGKRPKLQEQKLVQVQNPRMRSFEVGEKLYARSFGSNKSWIPVVVKSKTGPVSYWVRANDGQLLHRHLDQDNPYHCNRLHLRTQLRSEGQLRPDSLSNVMQP